VAAVNGLVVQSLDLGIVPGPILISSVVARYGWSFAPLVPIAGALLGASPQKSRESRSHELIAG